MKKKWLLISLMIFALELVSLQGVHSLDKPKKKETFALLPKAVLALLRKAGWDSRVAEGTGLWVSALRQQLFLIDNYQIAAVYECSTAAAGMGNKSGSYQTPTGWHVIAERIGDGLPKGAVLKERVFTGVVWRPGSKMNSDDLVLTRILWLRGDEPGVNAGEGIDSHSRYIYIHGTPEENKLGTPASHGCVRLSNKDVISLFDKTFTGMPLLITIW